MIDFNDLQTKIKLAWFLITLSLILLYFFQRKIDRIKRND